MPVNTFQDFRVLSIIAPYTFPIIWVGMCFLFSRVSGWSRLAIYYKASNCISTGDLAPTWTPYFATLGRVESKNVIKVGVNRDGLFLKMFVLFRLFHSNLFIPWSDISINRIDNSVFGIKNETFQFQFSKVPGTKLKLNDIDSVGMLVKMSNGKLKR